MVKEIHIVLITYIVLLCSSETTNSSLYNVLISGYIDNRMLPTMKLNKHLNKTSGTWKNKSCRIFLIRQKHITRDIVISSQIVPNIKGGVVREEFFSLEEINQNGDTKRIPILKSNQYYNGSSSGGDDKDKVGRLFVHRIRNINSSVLDKVFTYVYNPGHLIGEPIDHLLNEQQIQYNSSGCFTFQVKISRQKRIRTIEDEEQMEQIKKSNEERKLKIKQETNKIVGVKYVLVMIGVALLTLFTMHMIYKYVSGLTLENSRRRSIVDITYIKEKYNLGYRSINQKKLKDLASGEKKKDKIEIMNDIRKKTLALKAYVDVMALADKNKKKAKEDRENRIDKRAFRKHLNKYGTVGTPLDKSAKK